jgi:hypothetical protein
MNPYDFTLYMYNLALIPVIFFSGLFLILTLISLWIGKTDKKKDFGKFKKLPFVSVQIPTFNDPIAVRCVEKVMEFDYPRDRFEIIIVDDSTNPDTQVLLSKFAQENEGFVKYIHRTNREGFKPGALRNAMKITKGEIIVVFDSDWIPKKDFLRKIVKPFADPKVAIVQSRQGFYNHKTNVITRFAAYLLMMYHTIIMPINNRANSVFFCGTAGALRRKYFDEVGGWNINSVTEDAELSVKLLVKGYKTVYLDYETPSEVPDTFESFLKQQARWCYGNARVFFDNFSRILFKKGLSFKQRLMIIFITLSNSSTIAVVIMTLFGFSGWFLGEPRLVNLTDFLDLVSRFLVTAGFIFAGLVTLVKRKQIKEFGHLVGATLTMGLVLAFSNGAAFFKALINGKLHWFCTPKIRNRSIVK